MQRKIATFALAPGQLKEMKHKMLNWATQFSILAFLDSNNYLSSAGHYECLLAVESVVATEQTENDSIYQLQKLHDIHKDWIFGHICYDYKNILEPKLYSHHPCNQGFDNIRFFIPETVCYINREQTFLTIESFNDPALIFEDISLQQAWVEPILPKLNFTKKFAKEEYFNIIEHLRRHIADGDCYEINFCNEGYCDIVEIIPFDVFKALNKISPAPFAAYYRVYDNHLMCTSPERYLRKEGNKISSQPIKGTATRDVNPEIDQQNIIALGKNIKEQAENVMIVDIVRNDLARCCETGSINVDELFKIYTFPQVHQMISTISGNLKEGLPFTDAIRFTFPMGSMTGAPKFKVMQLIEQYEHSRRELFSGTVGYITPLGDFDFNVIIRSLFYNSKTKYLCYQTGGAITYDSSPQQEWDEMRLKAWALERIFDDK